MYRLFLRIFLWFWLATTSLFLVLTLGYLIVQPDIAAQWRIVGRAATRSIGSIAANAYEWEGEAGVASTLEAVRRDTNLRVWLYASGGRSLGGLASFDGAQDLVERAFAAEEAESRRSGGLILLARRVQSNSGKDYVVVWEAPVRFNRGNLRGIFSLRLMSLILTAGLVCFWLTWQITRPIRALRGAARQVSQGNLAVRIADKREFRRRDELSELGHDFDDMVARIEKLLKSQQQLLADISHELRSPLARVSLALDLVRRRLGDDVPEHQRIEREVHRLNEMIEQLLTLARLQGQPGNARSEMVNVRDLVHEIAEDARFEAEASGKRVVVGADFDATIRGSRALLRSAIENVVRNAVRHTAANSEVTINMEPLKGIRGLVITVRDHGAGVSAYVLDRLFDPFFRVDEGRDRLSGGVGLGLAITRQAMLFHGGDARAENHPDGGLLVRLELSVG